jgi:hypothetical protein
LGVAFPLAYDRGRDSVQESTQVPELQPGDVVVENMDDAIPQRSVAADTVGIGVVAIGEREVAPGLRDAVIPHALDVRHHFGQG